MQVRALSIYRQAPWLPHSNVGIVLRILFYIFRNQTSKKKHDMLVVSPMKDLCHQRTGYPL